MDKIKLIRISASYLILAFFGMAAVNGFMLSSNEKIDTALAEQLIGRDNEKINVIILLNEMAGPDLDGMDIRYKYKLINGLAGEATPEFIEKIADSESVTGIYFDESAQISFPAGNSSGDENTSLFQLINADKLWAKGIDGRGLNVAVIDSGIDKNHPDLIGKVIAEKNFVADETTADDRLGHGTMVAGIIAGTGVASNGKYKGIAPGASLLNAKVIDSKGDGKVSDIIAGIEWAIDNGADVLSLSLGGINLGETNPPITMAADNAADLGVVVCVAAGNRNSTEAKGQAAGTSLAQSEDTKPAIDLSTREDENKNDVLLLLVPIVLALPPGLIDSPGDGVNVITVGATDAKGHMAAFSGSGPTRDDRIKPDVVAPGMSIVSTVPSGLETLSYLDVYYMRQSGTSLSTPVAAGLAALLLQVNPGLTPAGVKAAMTRGAHKLNNTLGELYEEYYQGAGMLDALKAYQFSNTDVSGVIPDRWIAGRWAYLPAGKGAYVGLDTGADRPQKKIYALTPGDEDWNLRFVFFSNSEIQNLKLSTQGAISDWVSLQELPKKISANEQKVFAASIAVPKDAAPGIFNGSIEISNDNKKILSVPVSVTVAEPFDIIKGKGSKIGSLKGNEWDYYYLDVLSGTREIDASLDWEKETNLDLFLLSPTSEFYVGNNESQLKKWKITNPTSGRWLLAVHSENSLKVINYTLGVDRSQIEITPNRWNLLPVIPGESAKTEFTLRNSGLPLDNLSYSSVIENSTFHEFEGRVGYKETWNKTIVVTKATKMISGKLNTVGGSNNSEIALVFEDPDGVATEENAALGSGEIGPVEVSNPKVGSWTLKVYGYSVPESGQSFRVLVKEDAEEQWAWIKVNGPERLESDSIGTIEASMAVPPDTSLPRLDGSIKITSDNQIILIPVSVVVNNTNLLGITSIEGSDDDNDGYIDNLSLDLGLNLTNPGNFRLDGELRDCKGNMIELIDHRFRLEKSGSVTITVDGSRIWRKGKCGPLEIKNLILRDTNGDFIDRYEKNLTIDKYPSMFEPPAAYLSGTFINMTTSTKIGIGVDIYVTKPGNYQVSGTIVDDRGEALGEDTAEKELLSGNATIVLEFNPTRFMMLDTVSQVHLIDLVLHQDLSEVERMGEAWSSGDMDPKGFMTGTSAKKTNTLGLTGTDSTDRAPGGSLRLENGKMVISSKSF